MHFFPSSFFLVAVVASIRIPNGKKARIEKTDARSQGIGCKQTEREMCSAQKYTASVEMSSTANDVTRTGKRAFLHISFVCQRWGIIDPRVCLHYRATETACAHFFFFECVFFYYFFFGEFVALKSRIAN